MMDDMLSIFSTAVKQKCLASMVVVSQPVFFYYDSERCDSCRSNIKISNAVARNRNRQLCDAVRSKQQKFKNHQLTISTRRRMAMHEIRMYVVSSVLVLLDGYFFNGFWLRRPPQTDVQRYYRVLRGSHGRGPRCDGVRPVADGGSRTLGCVFWFSLFSAFQLGG